MPAADGAKADGDENQLSRRRLRARAHILCYTFEDGGRADAFGAFRARMADVQDDLLDVRVANRAITWRVSSRSARSLFVAARELLALLAEPARARVELARYLPGPAADLDAQRAELPGLPGAFEELDPDPAAASAEEQRAGREAHASLMASLAYVSLSLPCTQSSLAHSGNRR